MYSCIMPSHIQKQLTATKWICIDNKLRDECTTQSKFKLHGTDRVTSD